MIFALEEVRAQSDPSFLFIKESFTGFLPLLWQTLCTQTDDLRRETWILAMAGGDCLGLLVETVGDDVFPIVQSFISRYLTSEQWKEREAARHAFSRLLHGVSIGKLRPIVIQHLSLWLTDVKSDASGHVKCLSASIIRDIFDRFHGSNIHITMSMCNDLLVALFMAAITDSPNVASKACEAISSMVRSYEVGGSSSFFSRAFETVLPGWQHIVDYLVGVTTRENAGEFYLRSAAFEALNEIVRCSPIETIPGVEGLYNTIYQRLEELVKQGTRDDQLIYCESLWCSLAFIIRKLKSSCEPHSVFDEKTADNLIFLFVNSFNIDIPHEQAMLAMGSLAIGTGLSFTKYMQSNHEFHRCIQVAFRNFDDYPLCSATVVALTDVCRSLNGEIINHYDGILTLLIEGLQSNRLHESMRPHIYCCFGAIVSTIGDKFAPYLDTVNSYLLTDVKMICGVEASEQIRSLSYGILEAYVGFAKSYPTLDLMITNMWELLICILAESDNDNKVKEDVRDLSFYLKRRMMINSQQPRSSISS